MENYQITKEQILSAYESKEKLKELFPDAFKITSGWYNDSEYPQWLLFFNMEKGVYYGFNHHGEWCEGDVSREIIHETESKATEEEVFEALKNEAVKRGFVGNKIQMIAGNVGEVSYGKLSSFGSYNDEEGLFMKSEYGGYYTVFKNGKWATIIETITKKEAEKLLNKKIID